MPWYTLQVSITNEALRYMAERGGFSEEEAIKATRGYFAINKGYDHRIVAARVVATMHSSMADPRPHVTIEFLDRDFNDIGGRVHALQEHVKYYEDNAPLEAKQQLLTEIRYRPPVTPRAHNPPPSPLYRHLIRASTTNDRGGSSWDAYNARKTQGHKRSSSRTVFTDEEGWSTISSREPRPHSNAHQHGGSHYPSASQSNNGSDYSSGRYFY